MNKSVFIGAHFKSIFENVTVKVPTGESKSGFFGGQKEITRSEVQRQQTGWSDCEINGRKLSVGSPC